MASLQDFYQPSSAPAPGFAEAGIDAQAGNAAQDAGLNIALSQRNFQSRTLPDIVNGQAARNAFFSGATGVKADRARQDMTDSVDSTTLTLNRTLADLARQRILSSLGVAL